jgi:hypothetical protein
MNSYPKKPISGASDDPSIPVLTDRLGFPPLEFDTSLPMIDSTLGKFEDSSLNVPTVQPIDLQKPVALANTPAAAPAPPSIPGPLPLPLQAAAAPPVARTYPPAPPVPAAQLPSAEAGAAPAPPASVRMYGGGVFPPTSQPVGPSSGTLAVPAPGTVPVDGPYGTRIESEVRNAVLRSLAERLPQEIEAVVRVQMSPAIDRLIDGLAADTRLAVAACVREIVEKAVRAELDRLRPPY